MGTDACAEYIFAIRVDLPRKDAELRFAQAG